jgi:hypothetical protein
LTSLEVMFYPITMFLCQVWLGIYIAGMLIVANSSGLGHVV